MSITRAVRALGGLLLAVAVLGGCTGSGSGGTKSTPSGSASGSGGSPGKDVSSQYLTPPASSPIGGADGKVPLVGSGTIPVRLDVLSLTTRGGSTLLRARLSSDRTGQPSPSALSTGGSGDRLTGVSLVAGDQRFHPASESIGTAEQQDRFTPRCACAPMPQDLTHGGVEVSVQYGALPPTVSTVKLEAPGFAAFDVPVSRS